MEKFTQPPRPVSHPLRAAVLAGLFASAALLCTPARARDGLFYFRGDGGGMVTEDTSLKEFFGEPLVPGAKVTFDPGFRFGFISGVHVTEWFSAEFETGYSYNSVSSISGANQFHDVSLSNIPFLGNVRFELPIRRSRVTPYIGAGLGMTAASIDTDFIDLGSTTMSGSQSTIAFAYQAFGGIRFKLSRRASLSLEYHFFATSDLDWEAEFTSGTATDHIRMGGTQSHAGSIAFEVRF